MCDVHIKMSAFTNTYIRWFIYGNSREISEVMLEVSSVDDPFIANIKFISLTWKSLLFVFKMLGRKSGYLNVLIAKNEIRFSYFKR